MVRTIDGRTTKISWRYKEKCLDLSFFHSIIKKMNPAKTLSYCSNAEITNIDVENKNMINNETLTLIRGYLAGYTTKRISFVESNGLND
jgi:hypothetical protein